MSAFIVSHKHINSLVSFAIKNSRYTHKIYLDNHPDLCLDVPEDQQRAAEILLAENVRSINTRYPDTIVFPENAPGVIAEVGQPIRFQLTPPLAPVQALKACVCYDYQACENSDYHQTVAAKIIEAIRGIAIGTLPGYEEAKWEIS